MLNCNCQLHAHLHQSSFRAETKSFFHLCTPSSQHSTTPGCAQCTTRRTRANAAPQLKGPSLGGECLLYVKTYPPLCKGLPQLLFCLTCPPPSGLGINLSTAQMGNRKPRKARRVPEMLPGRRHRGLARVSPTPVQPGLPAPLLFHVLGLPHHPVEPVEPVSGSAR